MIMLQLSAELNVCTFCGKKDLLASCWVSISVIESRASAALSNQVFDG